MEDKKIDTFNVQLVFEKLTDDLYRVSSKELRCFGTGKSYAEALSDFCNDLNLFSVVIKTRGECPLETMKKWYDR